ncbi:putative Methyltransferase Tarbp1 [Manis pentadactyla]|nr:putative Methyltransferase Tarbp1 [Manis pentadactyla]
MRLYCATKDARGARTLMLRPGYRAPGCELSNRLRLPDASASGAAGGRNGGWRTRSGWRTWRRQEDNEHLKNEERREDAEQLKDEAAAPGRRMGANHLVVLNV